MEANVDETLKTMTEIEDDDDDDEEEEPNVSRGNCHTLGTINTKEEEDSCPSRVCFSSILTIFLFFFNEN